MTPQCGDMRVGENGSGTPPSVYDAVQPARTSYELLAMPSNGTAILYWRCGDPAALWVSQPPGLNSRSSLRLVVLSPVSTSTAAALPGIALLQKPVVLHPLLFAEALTIYPGVQGVDCLFRWCHAGPFRVIEVHPLRGNLRCQAGDAQLSVEGRPMTA